MFIVVVCVATQLTAHGPADSEVINRTESSRGEAGGEERGETGVGVKPAVRQKANLKLKNMVYFLNFVFLKLIDMVLKTFE